MTWHHTPNRLSAAGGMSGGVEQGGDVPCGGGGAEHQGPAALQVPHGPSGLRRQALAALGVRRGDPQGPGAPRLLGGATVEELSAGLAATGTDALVYLMAGVPTPARVFPGRALIVTPGAEPVALALPGLYRPGSAALDR